MPVLLLSALSDGTSLLASSTSSRSANDGVARCCRRMDTTTHVWTSQNAMAMPRVALRNVAAQIAGSEGTRGQSPIPAHGVASI